MTDGRIFEPASRKRPTKPNRRRIGAVFTRRALALRYREGTSVRTIDFSTWQSLLATLFGLTLVTLLGVGIRLLTQMTFQQRRERLNRQINGACAP